MLPRAASGFHWKATSAPIKLLAWSADGRTLASVGDDGEIRLWDAVTGTTAGPAQSVAVLPDRGRHFIRLNAGRLGNSRADYDQLDTRRRAIRRCRHTSSKPLPR